MKKKEVTLEELVQRARQNTVTIAEKWAKKKRATANRVTKDFCKEVADLRERLNTSSASDAADSS